MSGDKYPFQTRVNTKDKTLDAVLPLDSDANGKKWELKSVPYDENETLRQRRDRRVGSLLGQLLKNEGGIIIIKNSWGKKSGIE